MQSPTYYPLKVTMNQATYVLLWYSDDEKGDIFLEKDGHIFICHDIAEIKKDLQVHLVNIEWDAPAEINMDTVQSILSQTRKTGIMDAEQNTYLLNAWNFIEDFARTLDIEKTPNSINKIDMDKIYDKIFFGCGLPATTKDEATGGADWSHEEVDAIEILFTKADAIFLAYLKNKNA